MGISDLRREYTLAGLRRRDLDADPISQFKKWFEQAAGARASGRVRKFFVGLYKTLFLIKTPELVDVNAATLATTPTEFGQKKRATLSDHPIAIARSCNTHRLSRLKYQAAFLIIFNNF